MYIILTNTPKHTTQNTPQKFKLKGLAEEATLPYDGAAAYSLHHRARVMLTEVWAKELVQDKYVKRGKRGRKRDVCIYMYVY